MQVLSLWIAEAAKSPLPQPLPRARERGVETEMLGQLVLRI